MSGYRLSDYHERSKHRLDRYAPGPGRLDWANQPDPFRSYEGAPRVELPLGAEALPLGYGDLRAGRLPPPRRFDSESIGILFELSLAISAWKSLGGVSWALRCNPSSGNLHPTEAYLVTGGLPEVPPGVYHYLSRDHALERRGEWPRAAPIAGVLVGLASIYWREAWKYGMRAYRYCQHDCGHAIAALAYAAGCLGWRARLVPEPTDREIAALLGLDRDADYTLAEREGADCLIWISPDASRAPPLPATPSIWHGRANRLSAEHVEWPDVEAVHRLAEKAGPDGENERPIPAQSAPRELPGADKQAAARLILQRRSAVAFDGATGIGAETFFAMLDATLPRAEAPPWCAWPWRARVHPALFVHRVEDVEPGLYLLVRDPEALAPLRAELRAEWLWQKTGPADLPLYLLLPHDVRDVAARISCHQEIAADSCFALGMLARFGVADHVPWRYRPLHWECGLLGQALYLEAEAAGIRGTGIGCFFDDAMHALLGVQGREWQTLYHFTAGGPVEDERLTSLPAYERARSRSAAKNKR